MSSPTIEPAQVAHSQKCPQCGAELQAGTKSCPNCGAEQKTNWVKRLGPLGVLAAFLAKAKGLFIVLLKFKFILSLAAFMGIYWSLYGPKFGIGFVLLIVIHEMGHFIDVKRRGLPAEMPVFLPGIGAYVKWQAIGVSQEVRSEVSLAGPLAGLAASLVCYGLFLQTQDGVWSALAYAGAWLNILNLIPVWMLDGGQAITALSRIERVALVVVSVALWWIFGVNVLLFVAAGALWRVFTKDQPEQGSMVVMAYFLIVLTALAALMHHIGPVRIYR